MRHTFRALLVCAACLVATAASAQTPPPASAGKSFGWDQAAPSLADANAYVYKFYLNGAAVGVIAAPVVCSGAASPFLCVTLIPAFTPGTHAIQATASNAAGESPKSSPFTFTFIVTPGTPSGFRIL